MSAIAAVWGNEEASYLTYLMLYAQQHRGHDSAGIATCDLRDKIRVSKGMGRITQVFGNGEELVNSKLPVAIGQVRRPTWGDISILNAQPIASDSQHGQFAVASDGHLSNAEAIKQALKDEGLSFPEETSDTHVIPPLYGRSKAKTNLGALVDALSKLQGGYALACLTQEGLILCRDPSGYKPLVIGTLSNGAIVAASETCAFDLIEAEFSREVEPGEVVLVNEHGITSHQPFPPVCQSRCLAELTALARPDSIMFGHSVDEFRTKLGGYLAHDSPAEDADIVVPIPESGFCPALGFSTVSGLPFRQGITRNHYWTNRVGVPPVDNPLSLTVREKFNPASSIVNGKKVVLVHTRILRGHTSLYVTKMVREAGAREIHLRISSPPNNAPCLYGSGPLARSEMVATKQGLEALGRYLGADSLGFLKHDRLRELLGNDFSTFCTCCFSE
ncbi:MAG: amidophosphoribosyltransferase [Candidatus Doudnabacteria bacterium]|nr:amidophosphoribosyltransferase [Candidatus Doudnabacteria bacterium]